MLPKGYNYSLEIYFIVQYSFHFTMNDDAILMIVGIYMNHVQLYCVMSSR